MVRYFAFGLCRTKIKPHFFNGAVLRLRLVMHQKREEPKALLFFGAVDRS